VRGGEQGEGPVQGNGQGKGQEPGGGPPRIAKASVLHGTLAYLRETGGEDLVSAVLSALEPALAARLAGLSAQADVALPDLFALWETADTKLRADIPDWMERSGEFAINRAGRHDYSGIVGKPSPTEFLNQRISLFRLFYRAGRMEIVRNEEGRAVLRLVDFGPSTPLFCARQTGGLRRTLELAQGGAPEVRHVRCEHEGDAFCEWELLWG
jgi:hypothetical protein